MSFGSSNIPTAHKSPSFRDACARMTIGKLRSGATYPLIVARRGIHGPFRQTVSDCGEVFEWTDHCDRVFTSPAELHPPFPGWQRACQQTDVSCHGPHSGDWWPRALVRIAWAGARSDRSGRVQTDDGSC